MSLSPEEITEIRDRADIVSWIGSRVSLKKRGQNHVGLCPFHTEKSPSFSVHAQKKMFYCFGCHAGGDVFAFVMQHEGLSFVEAARSIAQAAGVLLADSARANPRVEAERAIRQKLSTLTRRVQAHLVETLWHPEHGAYARRYLEQRRIPATQAHAWGLGFGPTGPNAQQVIERTTGHAGEQAFALAREAGFVGPDSQYFLMSGRLTFPICSPRRAASAERETEICAWGGRQFLGEAQGPKYLNTCESAIFKKGAALFGLDKAQDAIRQSGQVVFVEGFFDVLAAERADISEAVAALGTAVTQDHVRLVAHLAKRAILVFDADRAGEEATRRATISLQQAGLEVFVGVLPKGEDPDSIVRAQKSDVLRSAVNQARPALSHLLEKMFVDPSLGVEGKAQAALALAPVIMSLRSGLARDLYMGRLAAAVGIEVAQLETRIQEAVTQKKTLQKNKHSLAKPRTRGTAQTPRSEEKSTAAAVSRTEAAAGRRDLEIISEMLLFPSLRPRYPAIADYLELPSSQLLLEALAASDEPITELIRKHVPSRALCERLCRIRPFEAKTVEEAQIQAEKTYRSIMIRLKCRHLDGALKDIMRQLKEMETEGGATDELVRRKQDLAARKRTLRRAEP